MVPNRRLRQALAHADQLARQRRSSLEDSITVIPSQESMAAILGTCGEGAAADILELSESEVELGGEDWLAEPASVELSLSDLQAVAVSCEPSLSGLQAEPVSRERSRSDLQAEPVLRQPSLSGLQAELMSRAKRPAKEEGAAAPPVVRVRKARKLPLVDLPSERSVVARIVQSVVAALPPSLRRGGEGTAPPLPLPEASPRTQAAGVDARDWRELRTVPLFDGLPNEALRDALIAGEVQVLRLGRDSLVPLDGALGLLLGGQLALAQFSQEALAAERKAAALIVRATPKQRATLVKKERKRRTAAGPLIRVAEKNLATFEEGDVVEAAVGADQHATLACFTATPAVVVLLQRQRVELWKRIYPFLADRFRRASAAARARLDATLGAKAAVADFFIRHGLSVSLTLRVRKIDACIECKACEKACEERYGVKRLAINGRILGNLDFVDACHTCTDQRCVDPCNFDAISFDAERREVLIKEDACTGCTLCASACPYDAIEMHELDDAPALARRLRRENKLGFGEGTPRKARLRRLASKCDHCVSYADQACITACPTGALLEILPSDAVTQLPEAARVSAKAGFDRTVAIDLGALNQAKAFAKGGLDVPELGHARAKRSQLSLSLWWTLGTLAFVLSCGEILLRRFWLTHSVGYWMATQVDGIPPDLALLRVGYGPGCGLAVAFGYAGTALMLTGLLYVWRRRFGHARDLGSLRSWFEWHVLTGIFGPLFILLHSAAKLDNWVSLGLWSMVLTVISGLFGRYLTTQLEERASTAAMVVLDLEQRLAQLRAAHPGVRAADVWYEDYRRRLQRFERARGGAPPTFFGAVAALWWLIRDDLQRSACLRQLSRQLKRTVRGARAVRRQARETARHLSLLERRRVLLPRLEPLFRHWKAIHVPMSIILTVIATLHIVIELRR